MKSLCQIFVLCFIFNLPAQEKPLLLSEPFSVKLWSQIQADSFETISYVPDSLYFVIRRDSDQVENIIVLGNGTEVGRTPYSKEYNELKIQSQQVQINKPVKQVRLGSPVSAKPLDRTFLENWVENSKWIDGLHVELRQNSSSFFQKSHKVSLYKVGWTQNILHLHLGASFGQTVSTGFNRMKVSDDYTGPDAKHLYWDMVFGLPGIRLGLVSQVHHFPEYGFIENRFAAIKEPGRSKLLNSQYYNERFDEPQSSITKTFELKYSYYHYKITSNSDLYQLPIHQVFLSELPMTYGSWGFGGLWSGTSFYGGVSSQIHPVNTSVPFISSPVTIEWVPLEFEMHLKDINHFNLKLSTHLYIANPFTTK